MAQKGEQIERHQHGCQVLRVMPNVVLEMIPFRLQHIVVFVFNLPARPLA